MSVKSSASFGDTSSSNAAAVSAAAGGGGEVVRVGYLKKLKTMRKKYFVLRAETADSSSRLEYYDNEKKYRTGQQPKRCISLTACFNINRRVDTKHKHVIALYTKDDCFCVVLDAEKDLDEWLKALLSLQHGEDVVDGEPPKPTFEHVWQVTMLNKGLGNSRNIIGPYHLCFTDKTLSLVRKSTAGLGAIVNSGHHHTADQVEFSLMSIRRCGHSECFFYMEVGRSAITGAGELWMQTEDTNIAQNMGDIILRAMSNNNNKEDLGPKPRIRSSSANEASKPILMQRRQTHCGQKSTSYCSPSQGMGGRERCDSMPSRARTSSEGTAPHQIRSHHLAPHRPQSFYGRDISHSPPTAAAAGSPVSPASAACSTDSAGSSLSIDEPDAWPDYADTPLSRYGHSLTPDEPIVEEETTSDSPYVQHSPTAAGSPLTGGYVPMAPLSSDDGYVDMSPGGGGHHHTTDMSPAASSCSITSGTPSTDMRFSEYHLEKVTSFLTPSEEDDTSSAERPHRAYSVGSRPDVLKLRTKLDGGQHENARVRAFSVGSRSKGVHNRVLPPHGHPPCTGGKSSSAPLLSGSHSHLGSSQNSMERMDDLMEMDFSKPSSSSMTSGYVAMSPKNRNIPAGYVEMKPGFTEATTTTPELPYMDMRPCGGASPVRPSSQDSYVDMRPVSSSTNSKDYMDMKPSTSPQKPKYSNPYYVEMTGKLGTSPKNNKTSSPIQEEYMDMDFQSMNHRTISGAARTQPVDLPKKPTTSLDGSYMEMLWQRKSPKTNNINNNNNNNDDYMNMSALPSTSSSSKKKSTKSAGGGTKKEKIRSKPIAIQTTQPMKIPNSASPVNSFATFLQNTTRKNTPPPPKHPPNYLPLNSLNSYNNYSPTSSPYSSLRRKSSRRSSKEITPTTSESSSTIFPFSPGSPVKPFNSNERKCAVDASSGTIKLTTSADYVNCQPKINHNNEEDDYAVMRPITQQLSNLTLFKQQSIVGAAEDVTRLGAVSPRPGDTAPRLRNEHNDAAAAAATADGSYELLKSRPSTNLGSSVVGEVLKPRPNDLGSTAAASSAVVVGSARHELLKPRPNDLGSTATASSAVVVSSVRPTSVATATEASSARPASALHYASLDLAPTEEDGTRSPHKSPTPSLISNETGAAAAPAAASITPTTFTYAEIDFMKSLKNNKIKH